MISKFNLFFFFALLSFSSSLRLNNKNKNFSVNTTEYLAEKAIERIKSRVQYLTDTSCKVAAKFMLLAICDIKDKKQLPVLPLSGIFELDLLRIREKLEEGYVLQIEIRANHHFIIFKKNEKEMYLLQAFQDRFKLSEWIANEKVMAPYLTIDTFFEKMNTMLNPDTPRDKVEQMILDLFLPDFFTQDKKLIDSMLNYFKGVPVTLVNVNYVKFNFGVKYNDIRFKQLFHKVDYHYLIY